MIDRGDYNTPMYGKYSIFYRGVSLTVIDAEDLRATIFPKIRDKRE